MSEIPPAPLEISALKSSTASRTPLLSGSTSSSASHRAQRPRDIPLVTTERGVVKQLTYHPLLLFSKYMQAKALATNVRSPACTGRTMPEWLRSTMDTSLLGISAALSDGWFVNLAAVNVSGEKAFETSLPMVEAPVMVFTVGERRMGSGM